MFEPNPSAVATWQNRVKPVPEKVASILSDTRRALRKVERRTDLQQGDRDKLIALVREDGRKKLVALDAEVKRASEALANLNRNAMKPKAADTASTLRRQAAWQRTLRILERTPDRDRFSRFTSLLQKAGRDDDSDLLAAMYEEAPSYAEAEGWPEPDTLRTELAGLAAPPEVRKALTEAKSTSDGLKHVDMAMRMADDELAGRASMSIADVVPSWDGELLEIAGESEQEVHESEEQRLRQLLG